MPEITTPADMANRAKTLDLTQDDLKIVAMRATGNPKDRDKVRAVVETLRRMRDGH